MTAQQTVTTTCHQNVGLGINHFSVFNNNFLFFSIQYNFIIPMLTKRKWHYILQNNSWGSLLAQVIFHHRKNKQQIISIMGKWTVCEHNQKTLLITTYVFFSLHDANMCNDTANRQQHDQILIPWLTLRYQNLTPKDEDDFFFILFTTDAFGSVA